MSDILKKLEADDANVDDSDRRRRGRPRVQGTWDSKATRISHEVAVTLSELPLKRGSFAEAIRLVAAKHGMTEEGVKKALKRSGGFNASWSNIRRLVDSYDAEIKRRTCRFPPTVLSYILENSDLKKLVFYLREHNINGDCPQWLVTAILDAKEKD